MPLSFGYLTQLLNATPMRMKNPPHSGLSVRHECLEPLGLSITKGAKVLSVTRQAMNNLVSGRAAISAELAIRLERALGVGLKPGSGCKPPMIWDKQKTAGKIKVQRVKEALVSA